MNPLASFGIEIDEIIHWHDRPDLFSGRGQSGCQYVVAEVAGAASAKTWLCAPISSVALGYLLAGRAQLRDVFEHTLTGFVELLNIDQSGRLSESMRLPADLPEGILPAAGERLALAA